MSTAIAQAVGDSMRRAQALEQQRRAAAVILARYGQVRAIVVWAQCVLRDDELGRYSLLYRVAERGISDW